MLVHSGAASPSRRAQNRCAKRMEPHILTPYKYGRRPNSYAIRTGLQGPDTTDHRSARRAQVEIFWGLSNQAECHPNLAYWPNAERLDKKSRIRQIVP